MDNTPEQARPAGLLSVPQARRPLSPWLRLAHVSQYDPAPASHTTRLRVLRDFEFVLQTEGRTWVWFEAAGGSLDVEPGDLVFIPPGYVNGWGDEPGAHIAVHFDLHAQPKLVPMDHIRYLERIERRRPAPAVPRFEIVFGGRADGEWTFPLVTRLRAPGLWRERLEPLVQLWQRRVHATPAAQFLAAENLGWALRTLREDAAAAGSGGRRPGADARILALLREIDASGAQRPGVRELAKRAHMGLTAFREAFQQATGRAPRLYMEERRVERAARALVETERSIYEIAESEGYEDPYHFSRIFKRVMGLSPRNYRRDARN